MLSGKTTLALEILSYLLEEAARDEDAGIPVLFALGNWPGEQKPLEEWLQDEMKLQGGWGSSWVKAREIIPILDGLDEVTAERRPACLKAISLFRDHYEAQSIVVTCRLDDYRRLIQDAPKLAFGAAYVTQRLSVSQVCDYLEKAGPSWESVKTAIRSGDSPTLAGVFSTPLLLAVATVAYAGRDASDLLTSEVTLDRLWSEYVRVMRTRRLDPRHRDPYDPRHPDAEHPDMDVLRAQHEPPSEGDVRRWLGWLVLSTAAMGRLDVWLHLLAPPPARRSAQRSQRIAFALAIGLIFAMAAWLTWVLSRELALWLTHGLAAERGLRRVYYGRTFGLSGGLAVGRQALIVGLGAGWGAFVLTKSPRRLEPVSRPEISQVERRVLLFAGLWFGLVVGLPFGLIAGLGIGLAFGPGYGLTDGLVIGLAVGLVMPAILFLGLFNAEVGLSDRGVRDPGDKLRISKKTGAFVALMAGSVFGLISALVLEPPFGLAVALGGALLGGVLIGLSFGLYGGLGAAMWHWILVRRSARQNLLPHDLPQFLDWCVLHGYMQREGGAYTWLHPTLADYLGREAARTLVTIADPWTTVNLAVFLAMRGQSGAASDAYGRIAATGPLTDVAPSTLFVLGSLFHQYGHPEEARRALERVIDSADPELAPKAAYKLGVLLEEEGEIDPAKAAFEMAIRSSDPAWMLASALNLGGLLAGQGQIEPAKAAFQRVIDSGDPEVAPKAAYELGVLLEEQGEIDPAKAAFEMAIRSSDPAWMLASALNLGGLLAGQGQIEPAPRPRSSGSSTPATRRWRRRRRPSWASC